ncbi:NlpC/P60 family protein [Patescibacteria group bacterium]|nr:NlpC/P60 family protein [Patescibacteria group bacterium]
MLDHQILRNAYQNFILNVYGKQISIPYRINLPPIKYSVDNKHRRGKSSPRQITKQLKIDAEEQGFNLQKATPKQVRQFMIKNKLGLDCSGFAYQMINKVLKQLHKGTLVQAGLPRVTRTNVEILTSNQFSVPVSSTEDIEPGDLIKLASSQKIPHVVIVIKKTPSEIVYAHSSDSTTESGVHLGKIIITNPKWGIEKQTWEEKTHNNQSYQSLYIPQYGDKVVRLKTLLNH